MAFVQSGLVYLSTHGCLEAVKLRKTEAARLHVSRLDLGGEQDRQLKVVFCDMRSCASVEEGSKLASGRWKVEGLRCCTALQLQARSQSEVSSGGACGLCEVQLGCGMQVQVQIFVGAKNSRTECGGCGASSAQAFMPQSQFEYAMTRYCC